MWGAGFAVKQLYLKNGAAEEALPCHNRRMSPLKPSELCDVTRKVIHSFTL